MKNWKPFNDDCPKCGEQPEVFTDAKGEYVYDGDNVECFGCGTLGCIVVDENDEGIADAYVSWNDYEDEM